MDKRIKDITGQQFDRLLAIRYMYSKNRMAYWEYRCACGKLHIARANTITYYLKKHNRVSCGCLNKELKTKHGYRKVKDTHPLYSIWHGMKNRCYNPNVPEYIWYGAKGVTLCAEWVDNPKAFIDWGLKNGYVSGLHIDKDELCTQLGITPHVYSPTTCQFVTPKVNVSKATNRDNYGKHPNVKLSHEDVENIRIKRATGLSGTALAQEYAVSPSTIYALFK